MQQAPHRQDTDHREPDTRAGEGRSADLSVWLIWAGIMILAIAALPFVVRSQDVVRALARMCGFDLG